MTREIRVIDTGVREGQRQIAYDQALIDLHRDGLVLDTIRFLRFSPCALVGRHQSVQQEIKAAFCRANGIGIARRISGGGAIYLDPDQVGWEIVIARRNLPSGTLADHARLLCEAAAWGLSNRFGIDARFRPRNDIEVDGRKLCGTGGFFDGGTLFYQGTVLVDVDLNRIVSCLNIPAPKLERHGAVEPQSRMTSLATLLGTAPRVEFVQEAILAGLTAKLGLKPASATPSAREEVLADELCATEVGTEDFIFGPDNLRREGVLTGVQVTPSGSITALVRLEGEGAARRIREAVIVGDFFVTPPRLMLDLEASLRGIAVTEAGAAVDTFFASARSDMMMLRPADFRTALETAIKEDRA